MKEMLEKIKAEAAARLSEKNADLEALRVQYLGKKGELTSVLRGMGQLSAEERPKVGQMANEVRAYIEQLIEEKKQQHTKQRLKPSSRRRRWTSPCPQSR